MTLNSSSRNAPQVSGFEQYRKDMNIPPSRTPQKKPDTRFIHELEAESNTWAQGHSSSSSEANDPLQAIYGTADIQFLGSQYGLGAAKVESPDEIASAYHDQMVEQVAALNFYEEMMRNAAPDIQRAATGKAETLWGNTLKSAATAEPDLASTSEYPASRDIKDDQNSQKPDITKTGMFGVADAEEFWRTVMSIATTP